MAQLTVRNLSDQLVQALRRRAVEHNRSAEAEHRDILRQVLLEPDTPAESFAARAARLRKRLKSTVSGADLIRADRDRDTR